MKDVTIAIATKNRASEVARCVCSAKHLTDETAEIIVIDDGSDEPIEPVVRKAMQEYTLPPVRFIRWEESRNYLNARNELVSQSSTPLVLLLDDDAFIIDAKGLREAIASMRSDPTIGAVAFPECDANGTRKEKQPGRGDQPAYTTHFYGYAHLLRRDAFIKIGGYRPVYKFYHEESDLCKRLLHHRLSCVYWPQSKIAHVPSAVDRQDRRLRRFRQETRNRCLDALCNEPMPLAILSATKQIMRFVFREPAYARQYGRSMTGGRWWVLKEMWSQRNEIKSLRAPLDWRVFRQWRRLRRSQPKYCQLTVRGANDE